MHRHLQLLCHNPVGDALQNKLRQNADAKPAFHHGHKPFRSKEFSKALGVSRLSFAPAGLMEQKLGTKIGAATVFSALLDTAKDVQFVFDRDITSQQWYGCSDGTTTGYMKVETTHILNNFMPYVGRKPVVVTVW